MLEEFVRFVAKLIYRKLILPLLMKYPELFLLIALYANTNRQDKYAYGTVDICI